MSDAANGCGGSAADKTIPPGSQDTKRYWAPSMMKRSRGLKFCCFTTASSHHDHVHEGWNHRCAQFPGALDQKRGRRMGDNRGARDIGIGEEHDPCRKGPGYLLPVRQLIHPAREIGRDQDRALSAGFASDLWDEIKAHDIHSWIWGHSHEGDAWTGQGDHGPIRFITNQRGYPGEETGFDPAFVLEV